MSTDKLNVNIKLVQKDDGHAKTYFIQDIAGDIVSISNTAAKTINKLISEKSSEYDFKRPPKASNRTELDDLIKTYQKDHKNDKEYQSDLGLYTEVNNNNHKIFYDPNKCIANFVCINNQNNFDWKYHGILVDSDKEREVISGFMRSTASKQYKMPVPIVKRGGDDHIIYKVNVSKYLNDVNNPPANLLSFIDQVTRSGIMLQNIKGHAQAGPLFNAMYPHVYVIIDINNKYRPITNLNGVTLYKDYEGNDVNTVYKDAKVSDKAADETTAATQVGGMFDEAKESWEETKNMSEATRVAEAGAAAAGGANIETEMEKAMRAAKIAYFGIDPSEVQAGGAGTSEQEKDAIVMEFENNEVGEVLTGENAPNYGQIIGEDPMTTNVAFGAIGRESYPIENENAQQAEQKIGDLKGQAKNMSEHRERAKDEATTDAERIQAMEAAGLSARGSEFIGKMIAANEERLGQVEVTEQKLNGGNAQEQAYERQLANVEAILRAGAPAIGAPDEVASAIPQIDIQPNEAEQVEYTNFEEHIKNEVASERKEMTKRDQTIGVSEFYDKQKSNLKSEIDNVDGETDAKLGDVSTKQDKVSGISSSATKIAAQTATDNAGKHMDNLNSLKDSYKKAEVEAAFANIYKAEEEEAKAEAKLKMDENMTKIEEHTKLSLKYNELHDKVYKCAQLANAVMVALATGTNVGGGGRPAGTIAAAADINGVKTEIDGIDLSAIVILPEITDYADTVKSSVVDFVKNRIDTNARGNLVIAKGMVGDAGNIINPAVPNDSGTTRILVIRHIILEAAKHYAKTISDNDAAVNNGIRYAEANNKMENATRLEWHAAAGGALQRKEQGSAEAASATILDAVSKEVGNAMAEKMRVDDTTVPKVKEQITEAKEVRDQLKTKMEAGAKGVVKEYHDIHGEENELVYFVIDPFGILDKANLKPNICKDKQLGTYDENGDFHHVQQKKSLLGGGEITDNGNLCGGAGITDSFNIQSDKFLRSLFKKIMK